MASGLEDLLALQDLDSALDQLRHRRAHLAERQELTRLAAARGSLDKDLAEVDRVRNELAERQTSAESELSVTEDRIATMDRRLYGGKVSATKDLQAMSAEIEHLKGRASALEDVVLEVLEAAEPLDTRGAELRTARDELVAQRSEVERQLTMVEAALDEEEAALVERRAAAEAAVPEGLIPTYEHLRSRLGGVGVARLVGTHCDGCHLTLSAVELDHLRHLPDGEVYTCEQCSRILVP
jgi:predicted  nucleic acid-binding Zn-ribbon protein